MPHTLPCRKRIWVVDDDETVLLLAEEILMARGFQVETFVDPARALGAALQHPPDLIVLDVLMPGMDGFEFCMRLRGHPVGRDVPVLMATSLDDPTSIDRAYEAGATDFASKPLNWSVEVHHLRYMLRSAETAQLLKATERETRQAKEEWERTFNSISDVVTLLSPELKVLRANSATVTALGRPIEAILGARCHQLFQGLDAPCPNCPILEAIETGAPVSAERRYKSPAAECLLTGAPVTDPDGRLLHVVHIARDLTEQKQLEMEYRHAQKMEAMGTLAGGIAHDFNNVLTVVFCYAGLIRDDVQLRDQLREHADVVLDAAQRGAALAGQLLTFSRKGIVRTEKRPLGVNDVVRDVQRMLQRVLAKNIAIHTRLADDLGRVRGSADQLHQVVMNLAVNASHAMPGGGSFAIETRNTRLTPADCHFHSEMHPGDFVLITVADTGHGMDEQTLQRIYEPFFTTKKVGEGTGLGLSVVYGIVKDHGGFILCYSQVGVGTTFKIYLPVLAADDAAAAAGRTQRARPRGGTETVLVVDDETHIRNLVRNALTSVGYSVIPSPDGESALARQAEEAERIRLVILDLGMPGIGGWECLKQLRARDPGLPVVITTGYGGEDLRERADQAGAAALVGKPFEIEALLHTVRDALDRSAAARSVAPRGELAPTP